MGFLIDMINVGQGDSFLLTIEGPQGNVHVLIDAGPQSGGPAVLDYVNKYAPTGLSAVVLTHTDDDHAGGMATILAQAKMVPKVQFIFNVPPAIQNHWTPIRETLEKYKGVTCFRGVIDAVDCVKTLSALANRRGMAIRGVGPMHLWSYGGTTVTVLNPTPDRLAAAWEESRLDNYINSGWDANFVNIMESLAEAPPTSAENDSSIVLEIECSGERALMTGDAGAAVIKEVTKNKSYKFLKVPHHGSKTGLDEELTRQLDPVWAAIPVGPNQHGHPCIEILEMLRGVGAMTYCANKTKDCRRECMVSGGDICFPLAGAKRHPGLADIDVSMCRNNGRS